MAQKCLYRSEKDKIIAGLCGGFGEYFDVDPLFIRIIFIILTAWGGLGIILYILGVILIPKNPNQTPSKKAVSSEKVEGVASDVRESIKNRRNWGNGRWIGLILLVLGFIALLDNIYPGMSFKLFWPVVFILIGLFILIGGLRRQK